MPIARREAETLWEGPLASGSGTLTSASGAFEQLVVTWGSPWLRQPPRGGGSEATNAARVS
jgi:lipoyl-dependent peroxiredoxin